MLFCNSCKNSMNIVEREVDNSRKLMYECNHCDVHIDCNQNKFTIKNYTLTEKLHSNNKIKIHDKTLPTKNSKCPHCKSKNQNPYEIKYLNNYYCINIICKNCLKNWIH